MAYKNDDYKPNKQSREILAKAWGHVQGVPYQVTARWLFYRLLQDGLYTKKEDYRGRFIPLMSRARHNEWNGWRPGTLTDDTRGSIGHRVGYESAEDWAESIRRSKQTANIDHWYHQGCYVEIWFEAAAMLSQFRYYAKGVTLRPFGGSPSIPFKYEIAGELDYYAERYNSPVVVLYFGDWDKKGVEIPEEAERDVRGWCETDFEFIRVGLNEGDGERLGIPANWEKPGYQWEALDDVAAREMIVGALSRRVDSAATERAEAEAQEPGQKLTTFLQGFTL